MCMLPCAVTALQERQLRIYLSSSWPACRARVFSRMGSEATPARSYKLLAAICANDAR